MSSVTGLLAKLLPHLEQAYERGVELQPRILHGLMRSLGRDGQARQVQQLRDFAIRTGMGGEQYVHQAAIRAWGTVGDADRVLESLDLCRARGKLNGFSYIAAIL